MRYEDINSLEREYRFSRVKTLVELICSSIVFLLWSASFFTRELALSQFRVILAIPPMINAMTWLFWGILQYTSHLRLFSSKEMRKYEEDMFERYDYLQYRLRRQKRIELVIELCISFQFAFIAMSFVMLLLVSMR